MDPPLKPSKIVMILIALILNHFHLMVESTELPFKKIVFIVHYILDLNGLEKAQMFNFSSVDSDRQWLKNALLSDSDDSSEEDADVTQSARDEKRISILLKQHTAVKRLRKNYHSGNEVI